MRHVVYDRDLRIEAYLFAAMTQSFPPHFHDYYVLGLIEEGERRLSVNGAVRPIAPGDIMLFNPLDSHGCEQTDGGVLRYRCFTITEAVMRDVCREVCGDGALPRFAAPVATRADTASLFRELHELVMAGASGLGKEELFFLFMRHIVAERGKAPEAPAGRDVRADIERVRAHLDAHYAERVTLDELAAVAGLNKFTLVRAFARHLGLTPYRYLETVRIGKAKELLAEGMEPAMAALRAGFSDQSHFTRYFRQFIGLTPGQYRAVFTAL